MEDRLDIRCHISWPGEMTAKAIELGLRTGDGDDRLKIGHLKFFADGGMGARTAWMKEKYVDAEYGMPLTPVDGKIALRILIDRPMIEIFANHGEQIKTSPFENDLNIETVKAFCEGGDAKLDLMEVYKLNAKW